MTLIESDFGKKLNNLCKKMIDEGYNYVCLIRNINVFKFNNPSSYLTPKPDNGLYFSKIITNEEITIPEWYEWIIYENFKVKDYEKSNLLFVKFDYSKLKKINEFTSIKLSKLDIIEYYNWEKISNTCSGVIIDESKGIWDIHQIVIWNNNAIIEKKFYNNDFILSKAF